MFDYRVKNAEEIPTPALLVYKAAVAHNIRAIGDMMGGYARLRPHIKTHKMSQIARMEMDEGIDKFKCATPKEAAMLVAIGATDVLISYHIVGANIGRVVDLKRLYPDADLKVIADDKDAIRALSDACTSAGVTSGCYGGCQYGDGSHGGIARRAFAGAGAADCASVGFAFCGFARV